VTLLNLTEPRLKAVRIWLIVMLATALAVAFTFKHVDLPVLGAVAKFSHHIAMLGEGLGSVVLLTLEVAIFLSLVITRMLRGHISPLGRAMAVACVSSICAYAINSGVLKVIFGVVPPGDVLTGSAHVAHLFAGSPNSSFPSGHMALAGAFSGVFMRHYPKQTVPLSILLVLPAGLLIVGGWHFVSDVLAGTFIGVSAGLLAAEVWLAHEQSKGFRPSASQREPTNWR
jgi:membrane-associated phospholipid phosphatase